MHFRNRGASIHLVRTTYNADTKRSKSEVVGRMPRHSLSLGEDVKARLTAEELAEVNTYVEHTRAVELLRGKLAAHGLMQTVHEAIEYAQGLTDEAERDRVSAIFAEAVVTLRRAGPSAGNRAGRKAQKAA